MWCDVSLVVSLACCLLQKKIVDFLAFGWFFEFLNNGEESLKQNKNTTLAMISRKSWDYKKTFSKRLRVVKNQTLFINSRS